MTRPSFLPEIITLEDVAERLAKVNRFGGGTIKFYSVAQHCCLVADQLSDDPLAALYGLTHDGHEPWTGEIPSPAGDEIDFRAGRPVVEEIKRDCDRHILPALGLSWPVPLAIAARVRDADARACLTEERDIALPLVIKVKPFVNPLPQAITQCWPWPKAEENFIAAFDRFASLANLPARKRRAA